MITLILWNSVHRQQNGSTDVTSKVYCRPMKQFKHQQGVRLTAKCMKQPVHWVNTWVQGCASTCRRRHRRRSGADELIC